MKEKFSDVWELLGYYQYIKMSMRSCPTILPKKYSSFHDKFNAVFAQSATEEKYCFIADVEKFVDHWHKKQGGYLPLPKDCAYKIFVSTFCPALPEHRTFGELRLEFKKRIRNGEPLPRRLKYVSNLSSISREMREMAQEYYAGIGLL